eukprot:3735281-Amphidinium_carterae.1
MKKQVTIILESRQWYVVHVFRPHQSAGDYEVESLPLRAWDPSFCKELKDPNTYYLVDPGTAENACDICIVNAVTITMPSPDPQHLGDWKKQ